MKILHEARYMAEIAAEAALPTQVDGGMKLFSALRKSSLFGVRGRARLFETKWPVSVYAIGDIHGCLDELKRLEAQIFEHASTGLPGERWIVTLGDHIDRGPDSAGVIDHLMQPPPQGFKRISLAGNHEQLMLDFLNRPEKNHEWLGYGGDDALRSYGTNARSLFAAGNNRGQVKEVLRSVIPGDHVEFLRDMPIFLHLPGAIFVHAGVYRDVPLEDQSDRELMWMRIPVERNEKAAKGQPVIVHGHTPMKDAYVGARRICLDTAAFSSGKLTAVNLSLQEAIRLFSTGDDPALTRPTQRA